MLPFRTSIFLLLALGLTLLSFSSISYKDTDYQIFIHNSQVRIDSCTFRIGEQSASLGDDIQQWINLLGPYNRCERKRTGSFILNEMVDSFYVWDDLGITLLAGEKHEWRVREAIVFLLNKDSKGVDTAKLHYYVKAANFREIYAETPNYIEDWSQSFGHGDEKAIREHRKALTELNHGNLSLPTLYPQKTFSKSFILDGSLVKPDWNIRKINKMRRQKELPLLAFLMRINTQKFDNPLLALAKKPWEHEKAYLNTTQTLEGIYGIYDQKHRGPMGRTTNGRIEFFVIRGIKTCLN